MMDNKKAALTIIIGDAEEERDGTKYGMKHRMRHGKMGMKDDMEESDDMESEDDMDEEDDMEEEDMGLTPRQQAMYESYEDVVEIYGMFDQSDRPDGAHYIPAAKNVFKSKGIRCDACVFWQAPNGCEIVSGVIEPAAACKLWIIGEK